MDWSVIPFYHWFQIVILEEVVIIVILVAVEVVAIFEVVVEGLTAYFCHFINISVIVETVEEEVVVIVLALVVVVEV